MYEICILSMVELLVKMFSVCFITSLVPKDWVSACIAPLYKGKGDKHECSNYTGISLLSVWKGADKLERGTEKSI